MTRALVGCRNCDTVWEYSGLHRYTAFCPNCSAKNRLAYHAIDVHRLFGCGDKNENNQAEEAALQAATNRDDPPADHVSTPAD